MCTVAFIPVAGGGYLLGHNRDESRRRARGIPPRRGRRAGRTFAAPRDPDGGGTWLGINDTGLTTCVLNAADADPSRLPREPLSRGRVVRDLLHLESADAVRSRLEEMRPRLAAVRAFHLVVAAMRGPTVTCFRWDGVHLTCDRYEGPALFVSSGYDQAGAERERSRQWRELLAARGEPGEEDLAAWLASHEPRPCELSVCMHRERASSVSRTIVRADAGRIRLTYHAGPPCDAAAPEYTRSFPLAQEKIGSPAGRSD